MESIKTTIATVIGRLNDKKIKSIEDDPEQWLKKVLTKKELEHIKVTTFKKGVICARVDSSVVLYMLRVRKDALLRALQKESPAVKDVRFFIGEVA